MTWRPNPKTLNGSYCVAHRQPIPCRGCVADAAAQALAQQMKANPNQPIDPQLLAMAAGKP